MEDIHQMDLITMETTMEEIIMGMETMVEQLTNIYIMEEF